ncbi:MICOS complex subunit mic19 [Choanephora cucurbitarum]|uniref:MICOS complex subunit mic19 n=1 Tax=Choanephora cucurbitarum TaxID=101091 RepID=A0A1C7NQT7_9FUNG|nr:MICOS complex subunit mic19 [Choanephora cucurbitarum]
MGASQSTAQEPVIFYNPNVPLQFSHSLIGSIEKKVEQTAERREARQVESIVRQRVAEELKKIEQTETQLKQSVYDDLTEKDQLKDKGASELKNDVEAMKQRLSRSAAKEVPTSVKKYQDEVIACFKKNKDRSLDCWEEVASFKQAVAEEQKKFIGSTYQK